MPMNKRFELDPRSSSDIRNEIGRLSRSYTPEWHFDTANPDIGSTIAIIFADQMADNIRRYNELLEIYHGELVNMMGMTQRPPQSAGTTVVMNLVSPAVSGTYVPRTTKLLGGDSESSVVFETDHPLYVTNSELKNIFMTGESAGKIIPVLNGPFKKPLLPGSDEESDTAEEDNQLRPFTLFDFSGEGVERNVLLLYCESCIDIENESIFVKLTGADEFVSRIAAGDFTVKYLTDSGFVPVDSLVCRGNELIITKSAQCKKAGPGERYSVISIESLLPVKNEISINDISFSSKGEPSGLDSAGNGNIDYNPDEFRPFGETLSLYEEAFLYHDQYFSRAGSRITLDFSLEFGSHTVEMPKAVEEENLKIIKRKPREVFTSIQAEVFAQEITAEYLTESGWRRIPFVSPVGNLFDGGTSGRITLDFICPSDWVELNGRGRCIRLQTVKCDNCYLMPAAHHYPVIKDFKVSYSYEGRFIKPDIAETLNGTERRNITAELLSDGDVTVFTKSRYTDNALYLGFNRKMEAGPVSMYFIMRDDIAYVGRNLSFEYSTIDGFRRLQVIDKTDNFTRTGQIRFMPPEDFAAVEIEERRCWWIRVVDEEKSFSSERIYRPVIENIYLNAVDVFNLETHEPESFYLETVSPNMSIELSANDIYDTEVWVNENGLHKEDAMREMLRSDSDNVKAVYDINGNIHEFYVKWHETSSFADSEPGDRLYILDRPGRQILFGDGVHVAIPRITGNNAIRVIARSCVGSIANVPANSITDLYSHVNFLGEITNPFPAYGGSNCENVENAMQRSASFLSNHHRLVTVNDYLNEVSTFSPNIDKAACIVGESVDGYEREDLVSLVLLMKDYGQEGRSFDRLKPALEHHLKECVEMTAVNSFEIVEPIGVDISVDMWLNPMNDENDYEIHRTLINALDDYLSPVSKGLHSGWNIGKLPNETQIAMKLNSLKTGAFIRRLVITASYTDTTGKHECSLEKLPPNKFYICRSGIHKAHILQKG